MNSLERVLCAIRHQQPDRVPINFRFCPEKWRELKERLSLSDQALWDRLGQDVIMVRPSYPRAASPLKYADPTVRVDERGRYLDIYGVPFRVIKAATGQSYLELTGEAVLDGPENARQLDRYPFPSTADWDYSGIAPALEKGKDKAAWARSRGCLQAAQFMRGMEGFLMDLLEDPGYAKELTDHIYAFVRDDAEKTLAAGGGRYAFIEYNDDIATQRGLMLSPALWRRALLPYLADFCRMAHGYGCYVRYHSCGAISEIIPDLIEVGVDLLDPVQPAAAGMDPFRLKKLYGDKICFHGALDIQYLLPNGTTDEVRAYAKRLVSEMGEGGGYIMAGSHNIQSDARAENILAAVDTVMA